MLNVGFRSFETPEARYRFRGHEPTSSLDLRRRRSSERLLVRPTDPNVTQVSMWNGMWSRSLHEASFRPGRGVT
ncbi:hypothetical protein EVAR_39816_1 [Eumeta japonica]|uniref:Uncharacterized protein n=1 Tax=Eumeta variegata TaxID=151549 RepID=A0A4C1X9E4_EUMVA|nr:hypothetical protein EVAR_39816_1 [Eumeta japonica]